MYNKYITLEKAEEYRRIIDEDKKIPDYLKQNPIIVEVCMAGLYLAEQLENLGCPESLIVQMQYSAGKSSFGKDAWEIHQKFLNGYKNNELYFDVDPAKLN